MHRYTQQDNLEACLQQVEDPAERAALIEEAFRQLSETAEWFTVVERDGNDR
jgi:hypothetical protein